MAGESEQGLLLRVCESQGLEAAEDDGVVGDDDGAVGLDGFIGDGFCEVNCEENAVGGAVGREEGSFEKEACVVPGIVCEGGWVAEQC